MVDSAIVQSIKVDPKRENYRFADPLNSVILFNLIFLVTLNCGRTFSSNSKSNSTCFYLKFKVNLFLLVEPGCWNKGNILTCSIPIINTVCDFILEELCVISVYALNKTIVKVKLFIFNRVTWNTQWAFLIILCSPTQFYIQIVI